MQKNLEGDNSGEMPRLTVAMMNEPLYLDVLSRLQLCLDGLANEGRPLSPVRMGEGEGYAQAQGAVGASPAEGRVAAKGPSQGQGGACPWKCAAGVGFSFKFICSRVRGPKP